jgi:hypothetical protein
MRQTEQFNKPLQESFRGIFRQPDGQIGCLLFVFIATGKRQQDNFSQDQWRISSGLDLEFLLT